MNNTRIYLIEDDDDHAELIIFNLAKHEGIECMGRANDGEFARSEIEKFQSSQDVDRPDLILLDLNIPKLDGVQLLRLIKKSQVTRTIPVVIMTTSEAERDKQRAYENGASSFLTKPMDFNEFGAMIVDFARYWSIHNRFFRASN